MDKVTFIEMPQPDETIVQYAIIDHGNEQFTSMLKSTYDEIIAQAKKVTSKVAAE
jgi:hypothetical protein